MKYVCVGKCQKYVEENVKYTIIDKDGVECLYEGFIGCKDSKPNNTDGKSIIAIIKKIPGFNSDDKYVYTKFNLDCLLNLSPCTAAYCISSDRVYKGTMPVKGIEANSVLYNVCTEGDLTFVTDCQNNTSYTVISKQQDFKLVRPITFVNIF